MESVKEVLADIRPKSEKEDAVNRFSKKNFNRLMKAAMNDPNFTAKLAVVKDKELKEVREVMVTEGFRKFLKHVLEKAGIDKAESGMVMGADFTIDNVDGLYEFMTSVIYEYMDSGNKFDFMPREDFRGSIRVRKNKASSRISDTHNPQTKEYLGTWEFSNKEYKGLVASSPCPEYLKSRKRVGDRK